MIPKNAVLAVSAICLWATDAHAECEPQPTDFVVEDPGEFGAKLSRALPVRDQFESDAEFEQKVESAFDAVKTQFGPRFTGEIALAFDWSGMVEFDADKGALSIPGVANQRYSLGSIRPPATGKKGYHGAYLSSSMEDKGYYESTNGYGAEVEVHQVIDHRVGIAWDNKDFKMSNNGSMGSAHVEKIKGMSGDEARKFSKGLKAIVRGRVTYPYFFEEYIAGNPTFNNPVDRAIQTAWLFVEPTSVCIVNSNGEAVNQWKIQGR